MGLFDFLKPSAPKLNACVWMNEAARTAAVAKTAPDVLVVAFFAESQKRFSELLHRKVLLPDELKPAFDAAKDGPDVCVVECHPLPAQNERLLKKLVGVTPKQPTFHVALDEPIMKLFGGGRIQELMQRLGMAESEMIEHPMVSRALDNARKKIAEKVRLDQPASSMAEWFARNVP